MCTRVQCAHPDCEEEINMKKYIEQMLVRCTNNFNGAPLLYHISILTQKVKMRTKFGPKNRRLTLPTCVHENIAIVFFRDVQLVQISVYFKTGC